MSDGVLVTGGTGFIGRAIAGALRATGREVVVLGRAHGDIAQDGTLDRYHNAGIVSVVHAAGRTFIPDSWDDPVGFFRTNVLGTTRVLEFCRTTGARLTHLSGYIYGQPESLPIAETAPIRANNPYAQSKHLAEEVCRFYAAHYGVPVTILRPFNVYGPRQAEKFLIPTILSQLRKGVAVEVLDLKPRRDYVLLVDLVEAVALAEARATRAYGVFNIGSGTSQSVAEIVATAQSVAGTTLEVRSRNVQRNNEILDVVADISAAQRTLGWAPRHNLAEGLRACRLTDLAETHEMKDDRPNRAVC